MTGSDQLKDCYLAALRLLTGQDYTALGLQRKLLLRKFSTADVKAVVERVTREGYLHDQRYAECFVASSRASGRFTGYRLRQELQRRGVPLELADELLRESPDECFELEQARELVSRRYRQFDPLSAGEKERQRVAGFLQRRGYQVSVIRSLLGNREKSS